MATNITKFWTQTLTSETLEISQSLGLTKITIKPVSGTVTLLGSLQVGSLASEAIAVPSEGLTLANANDTRIIDGVTIDASAGSCIIIGN